MKKIFLVLLLVLSSITASNDNGFNDLQSQNSSSLNSPQSFSNQDALVEDTDEDISELEWILMIVLILTLLTTFFMTSVTLWPALFLSYLLLFSAIYPHIIEKYMDMLYTPISRVLILAFVFGLYFWYINREKYASMGYEKRLYKNQGSMLSEGYVDGIKYHYQVSSRHGAIDLFVGGVYGYDFSIKREGRFVKLLKKLHLISKCQTEDKLFDKRLYLISDDKELCAQLKREPALRALIYDIFFADEEKDYGYSPRFIKYQDGYIYSSGFYGSKGAITIEELAKPSILKLHKLSSHFPKKIQKSNFKYREKNTHLLYLFLLFVAFAFFNGSIKIILDNETISIVPRLVNYYDFVQASLIIATIMIGIYFLLAIKLFKKSSRLVNIFLIGFIFGFVGFFLTAVTGLKEINSYFDDSTIYKYKSEVIDKHISKGKRTHYYITFSGFDEMGVNRRVYNKYEDKEEVYIIKKEGYLNVPWIMDIVKTEQKPSLTQDIPYKDFSNQNLTQDISHKDFSNQNLANKTFINVVARGADFSGSNLLGATFINVDLRGANFTGTNLSYTNFVNTNLSKSTMHHTNLSYATLVNSDLRNVALDSATLTYIKFENCKK